MIIYELTETTILNVLSKCSLKLSMYELFELIPGDSLPQEGAVIFIKTLNQLLEMEFVDTNQDDDGSIYWSITDEGRQRFNN